MFLIRLSCKLLILVGRYTTCCFPQESLLQRYKKDINFCDSMSLGSDLCHRLWYDPSLHLSVCTDGRSQEVINSRRVHTLARRVTGNSSWFVYLSVRTKSASTCIESNQVLYVRVVHNECKDSIVCVESKVITRNSFHNDPRPSLW